MLYSALIRIVPPRHSAERISAEPVGLCRTGFPALEGLHSGRTHELQRCRSSGTVAVFAGGWGKHDSAEHCRAGTPLGSLLPCHLASARISGTSFRHSFYISKTQTVICSQSEGWNEKENIQQRNT
jgi:hypothetical protein